MRTDVLIKEGERVDDLHRKGYVIIQDPKRFCFGVDAVILSGFARVKKGEKVLDLGTGTGILPILLEGRTLGSHFTGLEIQPESVEMARRSVALNELEEKVDIVEGDIKETAAIFGGAVFDVVTSNPPYMNEGGGLQNPSGSKSHCPSRSPLHIGGCGEGRRKGAASRRTVLYGASSPSADGYHLYPAAVWTGAQTAAVCPFLCG